LSYDPWQPAGGSISDGRRNCMIPPTDVKPDFGSRVPLSVRSALAVSLLAGSRHAVSRYNHAGRKGSATSATRRPVIGQGMYREFRRRGHRC